MKTAFLKGVVTLLAFYVESAAVVDRRVVMDVLNGVRERL